MQEVDDIKLRTGLLVGCGIFILAMLANYYGLLIIAQSQLKAIAMFLIVGLVFFVGVNIKKIIPKSTMQYNALSHLQTLYSLVDMLYSVDSPIPELRQAHKKIDFTKAWYSDMILSNGEKIYFLRYPVDTENWGVTVINENKQIKSNKADLDDSYAPSQRGDMELLKLLRATLDSNISPNMPSEMQTSWTSSGGGGQKPQGDPNGKRTIEPLPAGLVGGQQVELKQ